ncbi:hypothetical protein BDP27DRAFT_391078 [Rhodocollybia butyracea]|uniref:Uncharacterized protein n=1 Tax=Rhodocollybia butyracea TaxID=206335 RepID=A0A9P5UB89_9AGAR|nr:hypothetical protein BDP27DRAFT_391078 [Rhodocollybia butyracea]
MGRPDATRRPDATPAQTAVTDDQQLQWNALQNLFEEHFMVPHALRPIPPPVIHGPTYYQSKAIVAFIDAQGEDLGIEKPKFKDQRTFTRIINGLFSDAVSPSIDRELVHFKITGVDKCTEEPCFGFSTRDGIYFHPQKTTSLRADLMQSQSRKRPQSFSK